MSEVYVVRNRWGGVRLFDDIQKAWEHAGQAPYTIVGVEAHTLDGTILWDFANEGEWDWNGGGWGEAVTDRWRVDIYHPEYPCHV